MRANELRHRVTIQASNSGRDGYNNETDLIWSDYKKLWGKIEFLSVKDTITAQASGSETTARLKLNKRDDITTQMRVIHRGQVFQIVSPPKPDNVDGLTYMTVELSLLG